MNIRYAIAAILLLISSQAFATPVLTIKSNGAPDICQDFYKAFYSQLSYVVSDPDEEKLHAENNPSLNIPGIRPMNWIRLGWADFHAREPDIYDAVNYGQYDHAWAVFVGRADFFGTAELKDIYKLIRMKSDQRPELFIHDDNTVIAKGVNGLHASEAVWYGPRTYLIARSPGDVQIYEIDTDKPLESWDNKNYLQKLICEFDMEEPKVPDNPADQK